MLQTTADLFLIARSFSAWTICRDSATASTNSVCSPAPILGSNVCTWQVPGKPVVLPWETCSLEAARVAEVEARIPKAIRTGDLLERLQIQQKRGKATY